MKGHFKKSRLLRLGKVDPLLNVLPPLDSEGFLKKKKNYIKYWGPQYSYKIFNGVARGIFCGTSDKEPFGLNILNITEYLHMYLVS